VRGAHQSGMSREGELPKSRGAGRGHRQTVARFKRAHGVVGGGRGGRPKTVRWATDKALGTLACKFRGRIGETRLRPGMYFRYLIR